MFLYDNFGLAKTNRHPATSYFIKSTDKCVIVSLFHYLYLTTSTYPIIVHYFTNDESNIFWKPENSLPKRDEDEKPHYSF